MKTYTSILKVSNSKKTVLINRGAEDGLVVGDHAKFSLLQELLLEEWWRKYHLRARFGHFIEL